MLSRTDALSRYSVAVPAASNVALPDIARSGLEEMIVGKKVLMIPKQVSPSARASSPKGSPHDGTGYGNIQSALGLEKEAAVTSSPPRSNDRLTQCASPVKRFTPRTGIIPSTSTTVSANKRNGKNMDTTSQTMPLPLPLRTSSASDGSSRGGNGNGNGNGKGNSLSQSVNAIRKSSIPKPVNGLRSSMEKISALESESIQMSHLSGPHNAMANSTHAAAVSRIGGSKSTPLIEIETFNLASSGMSTHRKSKKLENDSQSGQSMSLSSDGSANSKAIKAITALTSSVDAVSFQQACKNRVAKQKKELAAILGASAGSQGFSAKEARASLREASAVKAEEALKRKRAEIYAINRYLGVRETMRYEAFLVEQERQLQEDDISWCSTDSSLMPTPRYRSEKERRYDNTGHATPTKKNARAVGGV